MAGGQERILRSRIKTMQATKKITRAMELIAGARIVKAQQRVQAAVPYSEQITEVVKDLAAAGGPSDSPMLSGRDEIKTTCYVAITADRGLCGGYNAGVQRATEGEVKADVLSGKAYTIVPVGRKAEAYFRFRSYNLGTAFNGFSDAPSYEDARRIGEYVVDLFTSGAVDRVELVYTRFVSAGSQEVVLRPLVPLTGETIAGGDGKAGSSDGSGGDYEFEPDPGTILDSLLPRYVEARVYAALLNAAASEHAFRQRAMKSATDNAEDLIKSLSIVMNRARQASITAEIMEIVGGAAALDDGGDDATYFDIGEGVFGDVTMFGTAPPSSDAGTRAGSGPAASTTSAAASSSTATIDRDDLSKISGIGPVIVQKLADEGVTTFRQIATWTADDIAELDARLEFPGRIERENWVDQAKNLHHAKYGETL